MLCLLSTYVRKEARCVAIKNNMYVENDKKYKAFKTVASLVSSKMFHLMPRSLVINETLNTFSVFVFSYSLESGIIVAPGINS